MVFYSKKYRMKNIVTLLFILIFSFTNTFSQETFIKNNNLKINVLSPFYNALNISYEHLLANKTKSLNIGVVYMDFNGKLFSDLNYDYFKEKTTGGSITFEYRNYFGNTGYNSIYVAPFIRAMYFKRDAEYLELIELQDCKIHDISEYTSIGIGALVGKQYILNQHFTIDFFVGPNMQFLISQSRVAFNNDLNKAATPKHETLISERIPNRFIKGYGIRTGITIGFIF